MSAVGITDHGTVAGIINFLKECRKNDIKAILGCETYLSRNHQIKDKSGQPDEQKGNKHLTIFAKNLEGFQNLCSLSQIAFLEGYYYSPRIDFELLEKHKEGIIVSSACLSSVINSNLLAERYNEAKKSASLFKDIFGEDFYLEIMYHGLDAEARIMPYIQKLGKELDIKVICTNDSHYVEKSDSVYQQALMCMSSGRTFRDPKRIKFPYDEFYFKSQEEMYKVFNHVPSYMINTLEIAEKIDYSDIIFMEDGGPMYLPKFHIPQEYKNPFAYLKHLATEGLKKLKLDKSDVHVKRLEREIEDIRLIWNSKRYDFATYFLIVRDIIQFAKSKNINTGIRGSGYGSLLVKCLGISDGIDPVEYNMMWERFLATTKQKCISESDFGDSEDDWE